MQKKVKWIIAAVLIIVIAIIATIAGILINQMQYVYDIEDIEEINYSIFIHEDKYGVIDKTGEVVIEPIYNAIQIPNPSKPIFICIGEYNRETKQYETTVFNDNNEKLFTNYELVQAISVQTNIESTPYEKNTLTYKKDGKYGLISIEGKEITEPIYDEISSIHYKEGSFLVKQNEKVGVVNLKGKVVIKPEYDTITSDNYYNKETKNKTTGFIVSQKTEEGYRYGYINYLGRAILKPIYTELERVIEIANEKELYFIAFKDGQAGLLKNKKQILNYEYEDIQYSSLNSVFVVQRNSKQGVVSREGATIVNTEYDNILFGGMYINAQKGETTYLFELNGTSVENKDIVSKTKIENTNYYITVDKNDIYSVVDEEGKVIIDDNYDYIEYLPGNYFIVARDGKNGVIDISGNIIIELEYTSIFNLNDTNLIQAEKVQNNTIDLYSSTTMHKIAGMENATIISEDSYIMLASEENFEYYDFSGNQLKSKEALQNNQLFAKNIDGKWGFVDSNDNIVVENKYEMVTDFNKYGFAGVKLDGKWGVIEQTTHEVIQEPTYELNWVQPNFIGKYYRVDSWHGNSRYSDNIKP